MHTNEHDDHGHGGHGHGGGYEKSDISVKLLLKLGVALGAMTVFAYLFCIPFVSWVGGSPAGFHFGPDATQAKTVNVSPRRIPDPPHPLLQDVTTAHSDMANIRRRERQILDGRTNPDTGAATLPISEAIEQEAAAKGR